MSTPQPEGALDGLPPALRLTDVSKTFGSIRVLTRADLEVGPGEIRALVGRNGSGKSTLIKILAGYHAPDPGGSCQVGGIEVPLPVPIGAAHAHHMAFVHQDLALIPDATVIDNLFVGRFPTGRGRRIPWRRLRGEATSLLQQLGVACSPRDRVSDLGQTDRALLAIARALLQLGDHRGGLLVLDEPTASLPLQDVNRLFAAVRTVAARGTGIIYVSHRLDEVFALADTVTVLRDGLVVSTSTVADLDEPQLIETMLGRPPDAYYPSLSSVSEQLVLRAEGVGGIGLRDFSLQLRRGEVVGVTGLNGAGHDEVPELLFGAAPTTGGTVTVLGEGDRGGLRTPGAAMRAGVAMLPADRQGRSGAQDARVRENLALPVLDRFFVGGRLRRPAERQRVQQLLDAFSVTPNDVNLFLHQLSGGNQQKALLAKWMQLDPTVLLLHEPTQGVDVTSKQEIFTRIERAAADGTAVVIASSESTDLAHLCHRVLVLRDGRTVAELSGADLTADRIDDLALRTGPPVTPPTDNGEPANGHA